MARHIPSDKAPALDWAQWYAEILGWPVFPCNGKVPMTPKGFHDASIDPFQIAIWWREHPEANIGTPTGLTFWALDIDPRAGGDTTLYYLQQEHGELPSTLLSYTGGGGNHAFWALPYGKTVVNKAEAGEGLDVQALGSYVILPFSQHPHTGKQYMWDMVYHPGFIVPQPAPAWLEDLVTQPTSHASHEAADIDEVIPEGQRNTALAILAIRWRRAGMSVDEIRAGLGIANQRRCTVPLSEKELDTIAYSKTKYEPDPVFLDIGEGVPLSPRPGYQNGHTKAQEWGKAPPALQVTDLADMLERTYPLPTWLVKDLIPEGLAFFVGSPKSSKTYLAYSLALSLAYQAQEGGQWLGQYDIANPGPVVYISLEDDEADSRWRVAELAPTLLSIPRERFLFVHGFELPRLNEGLLEVLRDQVLVRYHPSLVVLDPISYLYAPIKKGGDQFSEVRDMLLPLRWLGREYHTTILGVDHRRKKSTDDVDIFETTYGSNAKLAIADALLMIVRDDKEITIHTRVRKAQDQTLTLGFAFEEDGTAVWSWKGAVGGLLQTGKYGDLRSKILTAISVSELPLAIADMFIQLNIPDSKQTRNAIYQILHRAQASKEIEKTQRGRYVWSGATKFE